MTRRKPIARTCDCRERVSGGLLLVQQCARRMCAVSARRTTYEGQRDDGLETWCRHDREGAGCVSQRSVAEVGLICYRDKSRRLCIVLRPVVERMSSGTGSVWLTSDKGTTMVVGCRSRERPRSWTAVAATGEELGHAVNAASCIAACGIELHE